MSQKSNVNTFHESQESDTRWQPYREQATCQVDTVPHVQQITPLASTSSPFIFRDSVTDCMILNTSVCIRTHKKLCSLLNDVPLWSQLWKTDGHACIFKLITLTNVTCGLFWLSKSSDINIIFYPCIGLTERDHSLVIWPPIVHKLKLKTDNFSFTVVQ